LRLIYHFQDKSDLQNKKARSKRIVERAFVCVEEVLVGRFKYSPSKKLKLALQNITCQFRQFRALTFLQVDMGVDFLPLHFVNQGTEPV
jgi:hypothetical protein